MTHRGSMHFASDHELDSCEGCVRVYPRAWVDAKNNINIYMLKKKGGGGGGAQLSHVLQGLFCETLYTDLCIRLILPCSTIHGEKNADTAH